MNAPKHNLHTMNPLIMLSDWRDAYMELQAEHQAYVRMSEGQMALLQKQADEMPAFRLELETCRKELKKAQAQIKKLERNSSNPSRFPSPTQLEAPLRLILHSIK